LIESTTAVDDSIRIVGAGDDCIETRVCFGTVGSAASLSLAAVDEVVSTIAGVAHIMWKEVIWRQKDGDLLAVHGRGL
jgi:hypothetical protein